MHFYKEIKTSAKLGGRGEGLKYDFLVIINLVQTVKVFVEQIKCKTGHKTEIYYSVT